MGYKLLIAEKPSVARDIANVVCGKNQTKGEGYIEGNGYRVTWAVGHLVGLAEPEEYGYVPHGEIYKERKQEALEQLPLVPNEFKLVVLEPTKDQFQIVKKLMLSSDCEVLINCGDMGAEGHILQSFIQWKAGYNKTAKRFCATSLTDEAIRDAMAHLRNQSEFDNIVKGEYCKKKADWIMGMSLSRALTLKYNSHITVGRVQSPTLYFVVQRWLEVQNFKVTNYYGMKAKLREGFDVFWAKDTKGIFPANIKDSTGRVLDEKAVKGKCLEILRGGKGTITDVKKELHGIDRPQLYDITELEREANRRYAYTASQTLATAQSLYETFKVLSYPRTDSRYITSDLVPYMEKRVKAIGSVIIDGKQPYGECTSKLLSGKLNIDKKICDDSKVTDHHALIPTEKIAGFDFSKLVPTAEEKKKGVTSESLKNVLNLVLARMIVAFSEKYVYEQTSVEITFQNGMIFNANGKKPTQQGWKAVQESIEGKETEEKDEEKDEEQIFPFIAKGQVVSVVGCEPTPKKTTPPKLHTEATLLTAMENAGQTLGADGAILKGRGIGTQATRAEIIKGLFECKYVETMKKGKVNYIIPTLKGRAVMKVTPKELTSPKITADWEKKIDLIAKGEMSEELFMSEFEQFIKEKVAEVANADIDTGKAFQYGNAEQGECPWCGKPVYKYINKDTKVLSYYCSEKCGWNVSSDNRIVKTWTGKELTEDNIRKLMLKGRVALDVQSLNGDKTTKRAFEVQRVEKDGKVYCNIVVLKKPQQKDGKKNK